MPLKPFPFLALLVAGVLARPTFGSEAIPTGAKVPVAVVWGPGEQVFVALRDARQVIAVKVPSGPVVAEWGLNCRPHSLALADDRKTLLVGGVEGELIVLDSGSGRISSEMKLGRGPNRVVALPNKRAVVASLWEDAVYFVDWRQGRVLAEHPLPFSPRAMVARPDGRIIVADAFGGRLAQLTPGQAGSERIRQLDAVNLHALGLSPDGKELLVAHMAQYNPVPVTVANIDWGLVLSSRLSALRLAGFDGESQVDTPLARRRLTLDGAVHGAADPSALAITPDGHQVVIALAGAHQLLLNDRSTGSPTPDTLDLLPLGHNQRLNVVEVGRTPVDLVLDPSGAIAVTADSMSDSLSIVRLDEFAHVSTIRLGDREPQRTPVQRGEALFQDGRRAHDRWLTCASCHPSGHTNGLNFDTLGDGDYGAAKNTPSLLGVGSTAPYSWTGHFTTLADQVHQSLTTSLRGPLPDQLQVADLTAYLQSLSPPPIRTLKDEASRPGAQVFHARRCDTCHQPPNYTLPALREVGLDDAAGHTRFNPPSLRAVGRTAPYFHDGSAETLDEVLDLHSPGRSEPLTARERTELKAFLESL